jgi:RNA polymerase sigma-70 factor (ECF subfamily)
MGLAVRRIEEMPAVTMRREAPPEAAPQDTDARLEIELASRACAGDTDAFGELVTRLMKRAYVVAFRLLHNREDAEDLVQDAFVVAFRKLDSFEAGRPFAPWFFRILVRRGLNAIDARRVRGVEQLPDDLTTRAPSPDVSAERAQLRARIQAALHDLAPRQRLLVELVELEGFTPTEVAEIIEISPATARWHLHSARGALRVILSDYGRS